ncbi:hypothetical protein BS47DRAFT_403980 [Hydnum rufescens UP504]|uniref:Uncharacterized protein n=1 Tax=Hydnum rufescens UP504 TaxID=1448309 RepID=A0A9P6E0M8_9AGAM|nr:hypothetical protein BS47DRAFT_403980 [Hydnum rufescens UP504]
MTAVSFSCIFLSSISVTMYFIGFVFVGLDGVKGRNAPCLALICRRFFHLTGFCRDRDCCTPDAHHPQECRKVTVPFMRATTSSNAGNGMYAHSEQAYILFMYSEYIGSGRRSFVSRVDHLRCGRTAMIRLLRLRKKGFSRAVQARLHPYFGVITHSPSNCPRPIERTRD